MDQRVKKKKRWTIKLWLCIWCTRWHKKCFWRSFECCRHSGWSSMASYMSIAHSEEFRLYGRLSTCGNLFPWTLKTQALIAYVTFRIINTYIMIMISLSCKTVALGSLAVFCWMKEVRLHLGQVACLWHAVIRGKPACSHQTCTSCMLKGLCPDFTSQHCCCQVLPVKLAFISLKYCFYWAAALGSVQEVQEVTIFTLNFAVKL